MVPVALTIAGSDAGGGAGLQADLKTFFALGVYGASAVTAVTVQNTHGVRDVHPVPAEIVRAQVEAVCGDLPVRAVKTGMLGTAAVVEAVAAALEPLCSRGGGAAAVPLVVDPVLASSSGRWLLPPDAWPALLERLVPLAAVVTPNVPEAEHLTGLRIRGERDVLAAAERLAAYGAGAVVIKGGHLSGDAAVDWLYHDGRLEAFAGPWLETDETHGTGCTFASALAALQSRGVPLRDAVRGAKAYVSEGLRYAPGLGGGTGPLNHWAGLDGVAVRAAAMRGGLIQGRRQPGLAARLALYVIIGGTGRDPLELARRALAGGATAIQLREKSMETRPLCELARALGHLCRQAGALFIINDRADVAAAVGADGVHLGQDDLEPQAARALLGPQAVIGVTVETEPEARAAEAAGADYLGTGPVYATASKADAGNPYGPVIVSRIAAVTRLPVVGVGGIGPGGAADVIHAGAAGVAVIGAIAGAADPAAAARTLRSEVIDAQKMRIYTSD